MYHYYTPIIPSFLVKSYEQLSYYTSSIPPLFSQLYLWLFNIAMENGP